MRTLKELEAAAIEAHAMGWMWRDFWITAAAEVRALEPCSRSGYHRMVERLFGLVVAGDRDGAEPIGAELEPDEEVEALCVAGDANPTRADAAYTAARCLWRPSN